MGSWWGCCTNISLSVVQIGQQEWPEDCTRVSSPWKLQKPCGGTDAPAYMSGCHHVLLLADARVWQLTRAIPMAPCGQLLTRPGSLFRGSNVDASRVPLARAKARRSPTMLHEPMLCTREMRGSLLAGGPMATWAGTWPRDPISALFGTRGWRSCVAWGRQRSEDLAGKWGSAWVRYHGAETTIGLRASLGPAECRVGSSRKRHNDQEGDINPQDALIATSPRRFRVQLTSRSAYSYCGGDIISTNGSRPYDGFKQLWGQERPVGGVLRGPCHVLETSRYFRTRTAR